VFVAQIVVPVAGDSREMCDHSATIYACTECLGDDAFRSPGLMPCASGVPVGLSEEERLARARVCAERAKMRPRGAWACWPTG
jgi:hypothetical protein